MTAKQWAVPLAAALALSGTWLYTQLAPGKTPEFDHTAIHVRDLGKSAEFYEKIIGLEKIPDPFKDGRHVWFRMGPHNQLHVVGGATETLQHPIDIHFALRVTAMAEFMTRLDQMQVKYRSFKGDTKVTVRPDGVQQIYFQDPDGYWIEVNDDKY